MKPFEEINQLREIVPNLKDDLLRLGTNQIALNHADQLLHALNRSANSLGDRINQDVFQELAHLNLLVPSLLGVPMAPPLPEGNPEKIRPVILGILLKLEHMFSAASVPRN